MRERPSLQASVLCEYVFYDNAGRAAFVGCWSVLKVRSAPPTQIHFVVANTWTGGRGTWTQHTTVLAPSGRELARSDEAEFELSGPTKSFRADQRFGLSIEEPGVHSVEVYLGTERVLKYTFTVEAEETPREVSP